MKTIRIGAVSYLNTKPLVYGLSQTNSLSDNRFELSFDLPSRLADQLSNNLLDVALIPSIEILDNRDYAVVSDACIACRGPVWSVKFLSRVPLPEVRSVALDEGSRTSVAMTKLMLHERGIAPRFETLPIEDAWSDCAADAVLVIGVRAMHLDQETDPTQTPLEQSTFPFVIDMGEWWKQYTGMPFVFAMWTASPSLAQNELNFVAELLSASRDAGLEHLESIAETNAADYGLTRSQCLSYLGNNLHFVFGEHEKLALQTFFDMASKFGLAPPHNKINFHDYQTVR